MQYRLLSVLFLLAVLIACEDKHADTLLPPEYYLEDELLKELSRDEIVDQASEPGDFPALPAVLIRYGVQVYKITYRTTDTDGNPVIASGALIIPGTGNPMPLLSYQHGTIRQDEDAPSFFTSSLYTTTTFIASTGYIMALPDYLGYGSSSHMEHPYEHGSSLATAARDMLRAVREFDLLNNKFATDDRLFLTGYSEGGYATMALLKMLEEEHEDEFRVTAATVGAGAYNKTAFAREILQKDSDLTYLNSFLWVLDTYNKVYKINRPYSYYFNEPYAGIIDAGGVFANTELNPLNVFSSGFREGIINNTDTEFAGTLSDNDNYDWKPSTPLQLYHGTADDYVFYLNSSSAYEAMTGRGASAVELKTTLDGDHYTTVPDYYMGTFLFFSTF